MYINVSMEMWQRDDCNSKRALLAFDSDQINQRQECDTARQIHIETHAHIYTRMHIPLLPVPGI